jgi:hypothetical protein
VDIFQLRNHIIEEYTDYTRSFLSIRHPQIASFVQDYQHTVSSSQTF